MTKLFGKSSLVYFLFAAMLISSCSKPVNSTDNGKYGDGVLISNEGTYGAGNGSISYYNPENDSVINDIFRLENNRSLGDVVQSLSKIGDYVFIQVNNSNKIEVVDSKSFAEMGVIQNLTQIRYAIGDKDIAYATAWGNWGIEGKVYFIDVKTLKVSDSVATGLGPEGMILFNDKLFVANSGGWGFDNTVSIINPANHTILKTIEVGANPSSIVLDKNNSIWVLCSGSQIYDSNWNPIGHNPSKLVQINPETMNITKELELFSDQHPTKLAINSDMTRLYLGAGMGFNGIYSVGINDAEFNKNMLIDKTFYGFDVNDKDGVIFGFEAQNFTERGKLFRYDKNGNELGNYLVGIAPNGSSLKRD